MRDAFHDFLTESWKVAYSGNLEARLGSASELGSFLRVVLQEMEFRYATRQKGPTASLPPQALFVPSFVNERLEWEFMSRLKEAA